MSLLLANGMLLERVRGEGRMQVSWPQILANASTFARPVSWLDFGLPSALWYGTRTGWSKCCIAVLTGTTGVGILAEPASRREWRPEQLCMLLAKAHENIAKSNSLTRELLRKYSLWPSQLRSGNHLR